MVNKFDSLLGVAEDIGRNERETVLKAKEKLRRGGKAAEDFKKIYIRRRRELRARRLAAAPAPKASAKPKPKPKPKASFAAVGAAPALSPEEAYWARVHQNIQRFLPGDGSEITQKDLKRLCPPGGSVWNNWKHGKWQGHFRPNKRFAVPWTVGRREAGLAVVRTLWRQYFVRWGLSATVCPVKGLFQDDEPAPEDGDGNVA